MRNKFTLVLMAVAIAITGMFATQTAEAAKRKMVVEDHTGAWCGHCTRGMESLDKLEAAYGDEVITVAVHNGDAMAISSYQTPLAQMIGVAGYPNGSVSRINYNGKIAQSDGAWTPIVNQYIGTDVPVGVELEVDYNRTTGAYTATITANVESAVNANLGFNLWILQDRMTGTGSQWNQQNYHSKDSPVNPQPSSKYYNLPPVIVGFEHNNVFRAATAGIEGEQGTFPAGTVPAGTYKQVYTGNVSNMNVTDNKRAFFVAVVHNMDSKEIINGDRFGKVEDKLATDVTNKYVSLKDDNKHTAEIVLKNEQTWPITADLAIDTDLSLIPNGWGVTASNTSVTLAPNETRKIQIEVLKNKIEGFGQVILKVEPRESENQIKVTSASVYFMSENIEEAIIYGFDDGLAPVVNAVVGSGEMSKPVLVSGANEIIQNFPQMANFKTAVFTISDASLGFTTSTTADQLELIKSLMTNGCDLLIASCFDVINLGGIINGATPTAQATDFLNNTIGITMGVPLTILNQQGQLSSVPFTGVSGDPIGNGLTFNYNSAYNSQNYPFYARYMVTMQLNGKTNAQAFLNASTAVNQNLNENNNKVGIRLDNNGQRTVLFSVALDPIPSPAREQLFKNTLNWLKGSGSTTNGPSISLNTQQIVFGEVKLNQTGTETIKVTNTGDEALVISAINFKNGTDFNVKGSLPLTIDAGQTVNINVEFTPTEVKNYIDEITIVSNDANNPNTVISVRGIGLGTSSVSGIIPDVFTMTVGPNPVVNNSEIKLEINGSVNLDLELIDATGKVVRNIFNGVTTSNTLELNAGQLSSGTYYLNASVNGAKTQLPVVITK
ncbi:MAG: choice-of-anchor D domain-containing protein [Candidatus Kapaibacterium sp.]